MFLPGSFMSHANTQNLCILFCASLILDLKCCEAYAFSTHFHSWLPYLLLRYLLQAHRKNVALFARVSGSVNACSSYCGHLLGAIRSDGILGYVRVCTFSGKEKLSRIINATLLNDAERVWTWRLKSYIITGNQMEQVVLCKKLQKRLA